MSETEIKSVESALKKVNNVYKIMITVMIANIVVIIGSVWWASDINTRVSHIETDEVEIKAKMIDQTDWKYNDYRTTYMWAERWGWELPPSPFNTRGGVVTPTPSATKKYAPNL